MEKSNTNLKSGTEADLKMLKTSKKYNVFTCKYINFLFKTQFSWVQCTKSTWKFFQNFTSWLRFKIGQALHRVKKTLNSSKNNFVKKAFFVH